MERSNAASGRHAIEPLDFIAASRRVLHLASGGPGKIEFLREVSRLLLDFSGCDALVLIAGLEHGRANYKWSATRVPHESFRFEPRYDGPRVKPPAVGDGTASPESQPAAWFESLLATVLNRKVGSQSRSVTSHGSYWTGDLASELALGQGDSAFAGSTQLEIRSLAVVPFDVTATITGVVALLSSRKHAFTAKNVEYYEALAQTVGLAIDDRRAQHALCERVKELTCLYAIAQVLENANGSIGVTLTDIVRVLPPAWQFPDALVARVHVDGAEAATGDLSRAVHRQECAIVIDGASRGAVEVGYVEDRPEFVDGAFLEEEEHLLAAIAREISLFVQRCDTRLERQHMAEQVRQTDRLATIGQLAAGVAHEINEPLGSVLGFAQLARKLAEVPERAIHDLDRIIQAALHAREIVRKLMLFARQSAPSRSLVGINDIVNDSLGLLASRITELGIEVVTELDSTGPAAFADAVQLSQVVVNLCVNAIQAMPRGGTLTVRTRASENLIAIIVEDTGTGIPPEIADRIYEPFFTTKNPEHGTGLGLSVVYGIVTSHGGTIRFDTKPGAGTRFEASLPRAAQPPAENETVRHD